MSTLWSYVNGPIDSGHIAFNAYYSPPSCSSKNEKDSSLPSGGSADATDSTNAVAGKSSPAAAAAPLFGFRLQSGVVKRSGMRFLSEELRAECKSITVDTLNPTSPNCIPFWQQVSTRPCISQPDEGVLMPLLDAPHVVLYNSLEGDCVLLNNLCCVFNDHTHPLMMGLTRAEFVTYFFRRYFGRSFYHADLTRIKKYIYNRRHYCLADIQMRMQPHEKEHFLRWFESVRATFMSGARTSWRAVSFAYKAFTHSEGRVSENCLKNAYTMHAYRLQRARVPKSLEALSIKTYHVMTLSSSSSSHPPHAAAGTVALPLALPSGCSDRDSVSSYECRASPNNNGGGNTAAADASAMTPASFQAPDVASPLFFSNDNGGSSERNTGRDSAVGTPLAVATPYPLTFRTSPPSPDNRPYPPSRRLGVLVLTPPLMNRGGGRNGRAGGGAGRTFSWSKDPRLALPRPSGTLASADALQADASGGAGSGATVATATAAPPAGTPSRLSIPPKNFGAFWEMLKMIAFAYPSNPTEEQMDQTWMWLNFLVTFLIPCSGCGINSGRFMAIIERDAGHRKYLQNASIFFWFVVLFENTVRLQTNRPFVDYEKEVKRFRDMHNGSNNPMRTQTSVWTSDPIIEKGPWTPPTMPLK